MAAANSKPGYWLFKEEPTHYNFADLERDGQALWDGVTNNLARQNLRQVRRGDRVFYYHTQHNRRVRMVDLKRIDFGSFSDIIRLPLDRVKSQDIEDVTPRK